MSGGIDGRAFVKMHGLRNHFVIIDARKEPLVVSAGDVVRLCDGQVGVGADQLLIMEPTRHPGADLRLRIFNADGSEAEACGNGTRCVAWLLLEEAASDAVGIETRAGALHCERAGERCVRCEMGRPSMDWQDIPLSEQRDTLSLDIASGPLQQPVAVNVGNPHAVFFVSDLDSIDLQTYAPPVQRHPLFPRQVNVGAAEIVDGERMRLTVFERGAGLTMACGSGACAAVFAARARGLTDARRMQVELPGGTVEIGIRDDGMALMTGPVAYTFSGRLASGVRPAG